MSRGKYLSLQEAREDNQIDRFAKEQPSKGDKKTFDALFTAMTGAAPRKPAKDE